MHPLPGCRTMPISRKRKAKTFDDADGSDDNSDDDFVNKGAGGSGHMHTRPTTDSVNAMSPSSAAAPTDSIKAATDGRPGMNRDEARPVVHTADDDTDRDGIKSMMRDSSSVDTVSPQRLVDAPACGCTHPTTPTRTTMRLSRTRSCGASLFFLLFFLPQTPSQSRRTIIIRVATHTCPPCEKGNASRRRPHGSNRSQATNPPCGRASPVTAAG